MTDPSTPSPQDEERPVVIGEDRAKQGRRGLHILILLVVSATLAALALFVLWMGRSGDLASVEHNNARQASDVADVNQPADVVRQEATPEETQ